MTSSVTGADNETKLQGFPPVANAGACVLILGSMPGVASLAEQQYYAHPRNAFWFIMGELFGAHRELSYSRRKQILLKSGIALWDVVGQCHREGSLDSAIVCEEVNPLAAFVQQHKKLQAIAFNGQKAMQLFRKYIIRPDPELVESLELIQLPSTSPAMASLRPEQKLAAWRKQLSGILE